MRSHGYSDLQHGKSRTLICAENGDLDVFGYMDRYLGTEFPVIFGINACRVLANSSVKDCNKNIVEAKKLNKFNLSFLALAAAAAADSGRR